MIIKHENMKSAGFSLNSNQKMKILIAGQGMKQREKRT